MNLLDLDQLFYTCPYPVKYDGDEYTFRIHSSARPEGTLCLQRTDPLCILIKSSISLKKASTVRPIYGSSYKNYPHKQ